MRHPQAANALGVPSPPAPQLALTEICVNVITISDSSRPSVAVAWMKLV